MIAFTIATPDMMEMALECQCRVQEFCHVELEILTAPDRSEAFGWKLSKWLEFSGPTWFVDSDMWFIKESPLPIPQGPMIIGAPCETPDQSISRPDWFDLKMLICTSLVGIDMGNNQCRSMIEESQRMQREHWPNGINKYDGWFLNKAAQLSGIMICRLGTTWNWCGTPSDSSRNIHAAGRGDKLGWLRQQTV